MALTAEAEYALKTIEERGIRFIRLWFTDVLGFLKAFTITAQELEGAFAEGMGFDGSSIRGFSRIQESDMWRSPTLDVSDHPVASEAGVAACSAISTPDGVPPDGVRGC
jgi:glutamine synthetase